MEECVLIESPVSIHSYETDVSSSESVALSEALPSGLDSTGHVRALPSSSLDLQVELMCACSRIMKLESELASDRQSVKRARLEERDHVTSHVTIHKEEVERIHKVQYV